MKICIDIMRKKSKAVLPSKKTSGAAGFDLHACLDDSVTISPGETVMVPTGIAVSMSQENCAAFIFARSGLSSKFGITLANGVGVVDFDYRGEIFVPLHNISRSPYTIYDKDRIAQLVVMNVCDLEIREAACLDKTERNENGFGSTGR